MIGYIIVVIIISIIVSIITEQMLIRRLQLSDGILINRGRCRLKDGYGKLPTTTNALAIRSTSAPTPPHDIGEFNKASDELSGFYKPLK
jgi:hypothetical protein